MNDFNSYFQDGSTKSFIGYGEYFDGPAKDIPLKTLLGLKEDELKPFTKALLNENNFGKEDSLIELSRGLSALHQFQDILEVTLDARGSPLENRHFLYYESLIYLHESINSWLDKNVLSGMTLLRPFLELSVFHLYWYLKGNSNFTSYYDWLTSNTHKGTPSFQFALNHVIENIPVQSCLKRHRLVELKQILLNMHKQLGTYNHAPKMDEALNANFAGLGNVALEDFFYYLHTTILLLHQIMFLYILVYPMSLFPVEKHKKWGFGDGPVGLYFDHCNFLRLEAFIGKDNTKTMADSLSQSDKVQSLLNWFNNLSDLTSDEIKDDWKEFCKQCHNSQDLSGDDISKQLAVAKAYNRSMNWAMNFVSLAPQNKTMQDEVYDKLRKRMRTW